MLACFVSQRETLAPFGCESEAFRAAPVYDFTVPPHPGRLHYERFGWGVRNGDEWRRIAAQERGALVRSSGDPRE